MPRLIFHWIVFALAAQWSLSTGEYSVASETIVFTRGSDDVVTNGGPDLSQDRTTSTSEPGKSQPRSASGEVLVESQDGGVMLLATDGRIWTLQPEQIVDRKVCETPPAVLSAEDAAREVLKEMPQGFVIYRTSNYVIIHNTNEAYVRHVGMLFEQLHRGFYAFWKNQNWELPQPQYPLIALVFASHKDFLDYSVAEVGETGKSVIGYYHLATNRMTTFNVPNLERNVATIIHEATHQLAYNVGMQRRYADNPKWVSEGLAMFFEAPDFSNPRGWRTIGRVNQVNLERWKRYQANRPNESLVTLLSDDTRFLNAASATDAYGESWALTYFLLKTKRDEYVKYLKELSQGKPLVEKSPRERISQFEQAFGSTLAQIDRDFVNYMQRVR